MSYENLTFKVLRRNNYIKKLLDLKNFDLNRIENDNGFIIHHHFKWIELSKLNEFNLLPNSIKENILNDTGIFHYVIKED